MLRGDGAGVAGLRRRFWSEQRWAAARRAERLCSGAGLFLGVAWVARRGRAAAPEQAACSFCPLEPLLQRSAGIFYCFEVFGCGQAVERGCWPPSLFVSLHSSPGKGSGNAARPAAAGCPAALPAAARRCHSGGAGLGGVQGAGS